MPVKKSAKKSTVSGSELTLAIVGGRKTINKFEGAAKPKIGLDEFISLADTFGYSTATQKKLRALLKEEAEKITPWLIRYWNPNPSKVDAMEALAKKIFGVKYALAVNSGTSALNAAYVGGGIGPGDEVIVPAYTFFATVAEVVAARAIPVIAEVNDTLTIDPADIERKITPRTKAIVPVHMMGNCCDMDAIMKIAKKHKLLVIEDNAQACGGTYKGKMLGTIGDMGCFSISTFKITGGGEAGMVLTNNEWFHIRAMSQHDTGACWRPDRFAKERRPGELFCGMNFRLSELEGAVNIIQLQKTQAQAKRYRTNADRVIHALKPLERTVLRRSNDPKGDVGYTMSLIAADRKHADKLVEALTAEGVPCGGRGSKGSRDWHIYKYWEHIMEKKTATPEGCPFTCQYHKGPLPEYSPDMCEKSADLVDRTVFIFVDQWWTANDCKNVAAAINKVCQVYG